MYKYLIILVIATATLYSQDFEPSQRAFHPDANSSSTFFINADSAKYKARSVIRGWQWGGSRRFTKGVLCHTHEGIDAINLSSIPYTTFVDSCELFLHPWGYTHCVGPEPLNARGLQYEPTLLLNTNNPDSLIIRQGDTTLPVFGFLTRRGFIPEFGDPNFNRLIIDDSLNGEVVLADPWPDYMLGMNGIEHNKEDDEQYVIDEYLCRTLSFEINLRRFDAALDDSAVLKVELPYTIGKSEDDSYRIKFHSVPSGVPSNYVTLANGRGKIRKMDSVSTETRFFYITRNMLPADGSDITITAFFQMKDDKLIFNDNRKLKADYINPKEDEINRIKIRITKMNASCPLSIDWVRLATPNTDSLLRGVYDDSLEIYTQRTINQLADTHYTNRAIRLFRYHTIVEGGVFNWISDHYFNKLIGNISTSESGVVYPDHYERYLNTTDHWMSTFISKNFVSAPYSRRSYGNELYYKPRTYGLLNGYIGYPATGPDSSSYETYLVDTNTSDLLPITRFIYNTPDTDSLYRHTMNWGDNYSGLSYQAYWENSLYLNYFKRESRGFLFSGQPWWAQNFILLSWDSCKVLQYPGQPESEVTWRKVCLENKRPMTGPEYRLACWTPLILGAKGLIYDGPDSDIGISKGIYYSRIYDNTCISQPTRGELEAIADDMAFLASDTAGPDFLRDADEIGGLNRRLLSLDTLAKYTDRPKNKLYIGRKTMRLEMRKIHELIRTEENTLLNLQLQCWLDKGFKKSYLQHPGYTSCLINSFIDTAAVRTRYTGSAAFEGTPEFNYQDSSFYDLTILNHNSDTDMDSIFYLGAVNRRTSPLLLEGNSDEDTMFFYSDAEFDDLMRYGGESMKYFDGSQSCIYRNAAGWGEQGWLRRGCRDILIPLNYLSPIDSNAYCNVHFTELGKGTSLDNSWWRQKPFMYVTDTVLSQVDTLVLRTVPGEGKIMVAEILRVGSTSSGCDVCDSIQKITLTVAASDDSCCWDIRYKNDSKIAFTNIPIGFSFPYNIDDSNISFESNGNGSLKRYHNKGRKMFVQTIDTLSRNESGILATVCLVPGTHFNYTYTVGGLVDKTYCKKESSGAMSCPVSDSACCENTTLVFDSQNNCGVIQVLDTYFYQPCRYNISFDNPYDSCFYDVAVRQEHSYDSDVDIDSLNESNVLLSDYEKEMCDPFDVKSKFKYSRRNITDTVCLKFYIISGSDTVCVKDSCRINYSQIDIYRPDELYNENIYSCDSICIGVPYAGKKENSAGESMSRQLSMTAVPNPFSSETNIEYYLPEASPVTFELYNSLGIEVMEVDEGVKEAGSNNYRLDGSLLPQGVYYLRLVTGNESVTTVLTVIK